MIGFLDIALRLTLWFLLTADLSPANVMIGIGASLILPRRFTSAGVLRDGLRIFWKIVLAIPKAYIEAIEMMLHPHRHEEIVQERVPANRTPGLIFLDIFLITFTPKTIVTRYQEAGWYEVHRVIPHRRLF